MSLFGLLALGGLGAYWWTRRSSPNDPAESEPQPGTTGLVPVTAHNPRSEVGNATIASALTSDPGKYVPVADVDSSLYEAQIKHLSMANKFKYV